VVAFVNGRQVIDLLIDKRVKDGIVSIPRGLSALDVARLHKTFPILGAANSR
jgi:hypothetical protein